MFVIIIQNGGYKNIIKHVVRCEISAAASYAKGG